MVGRAVPSLYPANGFREFCWYQLTFLGKTEGVVGSGGQFHANFIDQCAAIWTHINAGHSPDIDVLQRTTGPLRANGQVFKRQFRDFRRKAHSAYHAITNFSGQFQGLGTFSCDIDGNWLNIMVFDPFGMDVPPAEIGVITLQQGLDGGDIIPQSLQALRSFVQVIESTVSSAEAKHGSPIGNFLHASNG